MLVAPTGAGKTVIAAAIVQGAVKKGKRCLFLVHRRELAVQASRKLYDAGIDAGMVVPGFPPRPQQSVQIASIQSLTARALRSATMDLPAADLVVIDEAHHATAATYGTILTAYPDAVILGLSATPARSDGRGLGRVFDCIVECPTVAELTAMGFLVPTRIFGPPDPPDLKGIKVARGDYVERELAERMDKPTLIGDIVMHYLRHGERRPAVAFAVNVAHSVHLADSFNAAGISAAHLDGTTPVDERDDILARLASGSLDVVTNCAVLTEGWDCPAASCAILARPTKSLGLYRQMAGRVLRTHPGKTDAIIIDHAGLTFAHGYINDEITWTLRDDHRVQNKSHASRMSQKGVTLAQCPECSGIRFRGQPCPSCGWRPRRGAEIIEVVDADLALIDGNNIKKQNWNDIAKSYFHAQLLYIARQKSYKPKWAYYKYLEKFGHPPRLNVAPEPEPPTPETLAWIKSRQIAYAKMKQKAATAT
jgi:superfamily II DNA or RNA helicase